MVKIVTFILAVKCILQVNATELKSQANIVTTCTFGTEILNIGETRWVNDPTLVKTTKSRDWQGFVVVCRATIKVMEGNRSAGDVIEVTGANLVLSELSDEYYWNILNHADELPTLEND